MRGIIFGATLESAYKKLEQLIQDYKNFWNIEYVKIRKSSNEYCVEFTNGDYWQTVRFSENQRGRKANVVLIDKNILPEDRYIAEMCVVRKPFGSIGYY